MAVEMRELYSSPNGDRWYLARDIAPISMRTRLCAIPHTEAADVQYRCKICLLAQLGLRVPELRMAAPMSGQYGTDRFFWVDDILT
jgi:hypothetical protein